MIKCKFYSMCHCELLEDALKTRKEITLEQFCVLINFYEYYCYDDRIKCYRFILKEVSKDTLIYPIWLLIEEI